MAAYTPIPSQAVAQLHQYLPTVPPYRVWAEIDTGALIHNYTLLTTRVMAVAPGVRPIAVVKADAYGHSMDFCVRALIHAGCRAFAVACIEEAIALRSLLLSPDMEPTPDPSGVRPPDSLILILGYTAPSLADLLARYRLDAALVSVSHGREISEAAARCGVTVHVHAALDTGMNRIGLPAHHEQEIRQAVADIQSLMTLPGLCVCGMFSHFAEADGEDPAETADPNGRTVVQYTRFRAVLDGLTAAGCRPPLCHICNSAASVRLPGHLDSACLDGVRLGINLYGYGVPLPAVPGAQAPTLRPVMSLHTRVAHVHDLLPGERVGYGGTYTSDTLRRLATLPVGYADGFIRAFRGAQVMVHTASGLLPATVVGRVCMDQCMVDITGLPVAVGDEVTLFGDTPQQLASLADRAGTIPYELLCGISARVPRVWVRGTGLS